MSGQELEPQPKAPESVREIPEEIPKEVEQGGIRVTPSQPQPVKSSNGQVVAQPVPAPQTNQKSVTVPAMSQQQLIALAEGSIDDSKTWFGVYWLRIIKRALRDGFGVLFGQ